MYIQCVGCGNVINASRRSYGRMLSALLEEGCPICGARIFITDVDDNFYRPEPYFRLIYGDERIKVYLEYIIGHAFLPGFPELDRLKMEITQELTEKYGLDFYWRQRITSKHRMYYQRMIEAGVTPHPDLAARIKEVEKRAENWR